MCPSLKCTIPQNNFMCRSVEYNYVTLQCRLSDYDRRTPVDDFKPIELVDAQGEESRLWCLGRQLPSSCAGIDYFENLCLDADNSCEDERSFTSPRIGVADQKIALHVNVHFYTDKELMANSAAACQRACEIEAEFLCRSYLFLGPPNGDIQYSHA